MHDAILTLVVSIKFVTNRPTKSPHESDILITRLFCYLTKRTLYSIFSFFNTPSDKRGPRLLLPLQYENLSILRITHDIDRRISKYGFLALLMWIAEIFNMRNNDMFYRQIM